MLFSLSRAPKLVARLVAMGWEGATGWEVDTGWEGVMAWEGHLLLPEQGDLRRGEIWM